MLYDLYLFWWIPLLNGFSIWIRLGLQGLDPVWIPLGPSKSTMEKGKKILWRNAGPVSQFFSGGTL